MANGDYPLTYDVDYPEDGLSRLTTLLRPLMLIPCMVLNILTAGPVSIPLVLIILFRRKYPRWLFDFNVERTRYAARVNAYASLLMDEYPSTEDAQAVMLECEYPDQLTRWMPLVKWLLAIPHWVIIIVLSILSILATAAAWFSILLTGRYPRGLFGFVVGVERWSLRVSAYDALLITDRYPPFRLS